MSRCAAAIAFSISPVAAPFSAVTLRSFRIRLFAFSIVVVIVVLLVC